MERKEWDFTRIRQLLREKAAREHRDITIQTMVRETGIPVSTLYRYLTNAVVEPAWFVVELICAYLDVKPSYFEITRGGQGKSDDNHPAPKLMAEGQFAS